MINCYKTTSPIVFIAYLNVLLLLPSGEEKNGGGVDGKGDVGGGGGVTRNVCSTREADVVV